MPAFLLLALLLAAPPARAERHGGTSYEMLPAGLALCAALGFGPEEVCEVNLMIERAAGQPDKSLRVVANAPARAGDTPRADCARGVPIMADGRRRNLILACFEP